MHQIISNKALEEKKKTLLDIHKLLKLTDSLIRSY